MTNEEFIQSIALEGEEWKDVVGFEGLYKVSSMGRMASMNKIVNHWRGSRTIKPTLLSFSVNKQGYYQTNLTKNHQRFYILVHRIVAEAFISNIENKPAIDHIDRNKLNNNVSNLRWCSLSENMHNPNTVEHCRSINHPERPENYVPVVALINGVLIKQYPSIKDAVKDGFVHCAIVNVCAGRNKTHKGYQWMYLSDYESLTNKSKNALPAPITADYPQ